MANPDHKSLKVWQRAMELAGACYCIVDRTPVRLTRGIAGQLLKSANSVHANIAEGKGKTTRREFAHFVGTARGSLREVESHLLELRLARGLDTPDLNRALALTEECSRMLTTLLARLLVE